MSSSRPAPSQAYSDSTPCRDTPLNEWRPPRFPHCLRPNSHRKTVTETNLATTGVLQLTGPFCLATTPPLARRLGNRAIDLAVRSSVAVRQTTPEGYGYHPALPPLARAIRPTDHAAMPSHGCGWRHRRRHRMDSHVFMRHPAAPTGGQVPTRAPCWHEPRCPAADAVDHGAARVVAARPEQGWSLLCNGVISFEDTGELLPDGYASEPHRGPLQVKPRSAPLVSPLQYLDGTEGQISRRIRAFWLS